MTKNSCKTCNFYHLGAADDEPAIKVCTLSGDVQYISDNTHWKNESTIKDWWDTRIIPDWCPLNSKCIKKQ